MSENKPISRTTIYAHGSLGMPMAVYGYPLAIWLGPHYSGVIGLDLATVGLILMLARFTDVITDPLIGEIFHFKKSGTGLAQKRYLQFFS